MKPLTAALKALADPARIRIVAALRHRELCVCELFDALGMNQSSLSSHLRPLRETGLVTTRKDGRWIYYAIAPENAEFIDDVFTRFQRQLKRDPRLALDARNLKSRLAKRRKGCCVIGFAQPQSKKKRGEPKCAGC